MSFGKWWLHGLASAAMLLMVGCAPSAEEQAPPAASSVEQEGEDHADHDHADAADDPAVASPATGGEMAAEEENNTPTDPAGGTELSTPTAEATPEPPAAAAPDEAVTAVLKGLKEGKAVVLWDFLPASYQEDVQTILRESAENSDPDMHRQIFRTLQKLVNVLKEKKDFLLANPMLQQPGLPIAELEANWDQLVGLLGTIVNSELADPEKLEAIEPRKFLDETGDKVLSDLISLAEKSPQNPIAQLDEVQVSVIEQGDESAVLEITAPGQEPNQVNMVKVEGKWISEDIQQGWKEQVSQMREQLKATGEKQDEAQKQQVMSMLAMLDQSLDGLQQAENEQQFNQQFQLMMQMAMGAVMALQPQPGATSTPSVDSVDIVIRGELTEEQETELLDKLAKLTDKEDEALYSVAPLGDRTLVTIGPIKDVQAFADKLDIGKVTKVDAEGRTITVEVE